MALLEEYYELNEADEVSASWKIFQIGFYLGAGCLGLWCGYTMALIRRRFEDKCYLFTNFKRGPDWENEFWCNYCQYTMVSSFIVATIWATFFLMCGKGGKSLTGLPQPWRIVFCSFIFNIIYFSVALSASIKIQQGTMMFCGKQDQLELELEIKSSLLRCHPLNVLFPKNSELFRTTYFLLDRVMKTSWCCTFAWLMLIFISFFRIVFAVDFRMYKICVFQIDDTFHNKKEEVLKITIYEEPKKIDGSEDKEKTVHYDTENEVRDLETGGNEPEQKPTQFRSGQSPLKPNAAFYVTADIRMLNTENKRKKMKVFDEAFQKNQNLRGKKFRLSHDSLNFPEDSPSNRYLYRYPNLGHNPRGGKQEVGTSDDEKMPNKNTAKLEDDSYRSDSDDSVLENRSENFKKQV